MQTNIWAVGYAAGVDIGVYFLRTHQSHGLPVSAALWEGARNAVRAIAPGAAIISITPLEEIPPSAQRST